MSGKGLVAVTGASGNLGRRVTGRLAAAGYSIRLLSRERPANIDAEWHPFELAAPIDAVGLAGCNAVVHLAAHIPVRHDDPAEAEACLLANGAGTVRLLDAATAAEVGRLVQVTAANAYRDDGIAADEQAPLYPARRAPFYLGSKLIQDMVGEHWRLTGRLPVTSLRASSLYGAGQERGTITDMARTLLAGETVRLAGGGQFAADFVTLDDVADAILLVLERGSDGVFNIASGQRSTIGEVASLLVKLAGASDDQLEVVGEGQAEGFPAIDISKARAEGFRPTPLAEGLRQLVDWLR